MTTEQLENNIAALRAFHAGKPVQARAFGSVSQEWVDLSVDPSFRIDFYEYRPKPEPKLRPWTQDEVPLGAEVKRKSGDISRAIILAADDNCAYTHFGKATLAEAASDFTLADGSPCGVAE